MPPSIVDDEKENMPPAKKNKIASIENEVQHRAGRTFTITNMGGQTFEISICGRSHVGELETKVAKIMGLGYCFTLIGMDGQQLNDISASLPSENELSCQIENPSVLCPAAQQILKSVIPEGRECPKDRDALRLGRYRELGQFPGSEWKNWDCTSVDSEDEADDATDEEIDSYGDYSVYEFTLIDGDDKRHRLIGVINEGSEDAIGMWGSIYLRPGMEEVGKLRACGRKEGKYETWEDLHGKKSTWILKKTDWYKRPINLPRCKSLLHGGGGNASCQLQNHLAHALYKCIPWNGYYWQDGRKVLDSGENDDISSIFLLEDDDDEGSHEDIDESGSENEEGEEENGEGEEENEEDEKGEDEEEDGEDEGEDCEEEENGADEEEHGVDDDCEEEENGEDEEEVEDI